ncbi:hypothetical protein GCM10010245_49760 [Streptomyces spectabilis]|nr:hypothetical protein GCM10010245_49760 [Streptomyces spectabilis]
MRRMRSAGAAHRVDDGVGLKLSDNTAVRFPVKDSGDPGTGELQPAGLAPHRGHVLLGGYAPTYVALEQFPCHADQFIARHPELARPRRVHFDLFTRCQ